MSDWKATRQGKPSKTIRCEDCTARWHSYVDAGGTLPGPIVRFASVTLAEGGARRKLCGPCFLGRKDEHDREEAAR